MRLGAIVLVCACAGPAFAEPDAFEDLRIPTCWTEHNVVPANGARSVPLNAKAYLFAFPAMAFELREGHRTRALPRTSHLPAVIQELDLAPLAPGRHYTISAEDHVLAAFTTGKSLDTVPPQPPAFEWLAVRQPWSSSPIVSMKVKASADTVLLAVAHGGAEILTPPSGLSGNGRCAGSLPLRPDRPHEMCFTITAIDIAGNRSEAVSRCANFDEEAEPVPISDPAGSDPMTVTAPPVSSSHWTTLAIGVVVMLVLGVGVAATTSRLAHRAFAAMPPVEPVPGDIVRIVVRTQRRWAALIAAGLLAVSAALLVLERPVSTCLVLLAVPVVLFAFSAAAALRLTRIARLIRDPDLENGFVDGNYLFVGRDGVLHGWVAISPRTLARANATTIPRATLRNS